jgi:hypothetical protein
MTTPALPLTVVETPSLSALPPTAPVHMGPYASLSDAPADVQKWADELFRFLLTQPIALLANVLAYSEYSRELLRMTSATYAYTYTHRARDDVQQLTIALLLLCPVVYLLFFLLFLLLFLRVVPLAVPPTVPPAVPLAVLPPASFRCSSRCSSSCFLPLLLLLFLLLSRLAAQSNKRSWRPASRSINPISYRQRRRTSVLLNS